MESSEISAISPEIKTFNCENEEDRDSILSLLRQAVTDQPIYVVNSSLKKLMKLFFDDHKRIEAAGGIVLNRENQILFIDRLGYWDLPKGKVEKDEELKLAAIREVEEECGITGPKIDRKLLKTFHTYAAGRRKFLKTTHWYLMRYIGDEQLIPQEEEGITAVRWVDRDNMSEQTSRTYNSILDVLEYYKKM